MEAWPVVDHPEGVVIEAWVVPGSSQAAIAGLHDGAVRLRVAAPAAGGAANRAAARLLRDTLQVRRVELLAGASSRRKRFLVAGIDAARAARLLGLEPRARPSGGTC